MNNKDRENKKKTANIIWFILSTFFSILTLLLELFLDAAISQSELTKEQTSSFLGMMCLLALVSSIISSIAIIKVKRWYKALTILCLIVSIIIFVLALIAFYASGVGNY